MHRLIFFLAILLSVPSVYADPKKTIEGVYYEVLEEDFEKMTVKSRHELHDNQGKRHRLKFKDSPKIKSGSKVMVTGTEANGELNVEESMEAEAMASTPLIPDPHGEQKTIAILMNFSNNPTSKPWTVDQVKSTLFTAPNSVDKFYKETSFNKTWFTGNAIGWVTIPLPNSPCNYWDWGTEADKKALELGVDVNNYHRKVYVFPKTTACSFGGVAYVGGNQAWMNGYNDSRLFSHELGHCLGVRHASTINCGGYAIATNCSVSEYGDVYDTMGNWNLFQFNGGHKRQIGFTHYTAHKYLRPNSPFYPGAGTYSIKPLEKVLAPDSGTQVIYFERPDKIGDQYEISYRQNTGFDTSLPGGITSGVSIQLSDIYGGNTRLIDTTPGDGTFSNASLSDGRSFYDPANKIRVKQLSHNADEATVSIEFGDIVDTDPPTLTLKPVRATITADAKDDIGIERVEFWVNGVLKYTDKSYVYSYSFDAILGATYAVEVKAFDGAGHVASSKVNVQSFKNPGE